jgi:hypothetical protein
VNGNYKLSFLILYVKGASLASIETSSSKKLSISEKKYASTPRFKFLIPTGNILVMICTRREERFLQGFEDSVLALFALCQQSMGPTNLLEFPTKQESAGNCSKKAKCGGLRNLWLDEDTGTDT